MLVRHALMPASGRWVGVAHWRALPKDEERTYRYTKFTQEESRFRSRGN